MREQFSSGGGREGNSVLKKFVSKTLDLQLKKFWPLPKVAQNPNIVHLPIDDLGTVNIAEVFSKYIFWSFRHAGWRSLANWEYRCVTLSLQPVRLPCPSYCLDLVRVGKTNVHSDQNNLSEALKSSLHLVSGLVPVLQLSGLNSFFSSFFLLKSRTRQFISVKDWVDRVVLPWWRCRFRVVFILNVQCDN